MSSYHCYLRAGGGGGVKGGGGGIQNEWLIQKADSSSDDSEMDMMFDRETFYRHIKISGGINKVGHKSIFKIN